MSTSCEFEVINEPGSLAAAIEELSRWMEDQQAAPAAAYLATLAL